jgi:hypothetical protein
MVTNLWEITPWRWHHYSRFREKTRRILFVATVVLDVIQPYSLCEHNPIKLPGRKAHSRLCVAVVLIANSTKQSFFIHIEYSSTVIRQARLKNDVHKKEQPVRCIGKNSHQKSKPSEAPSTVRAVLPVLQLTRHAHLFILFYDTGLARSHSRAFHMKFKRGGNASRSCFS